MRISREIVDRFSNLVLDSVNRACSFKTQFKLENEIWISILWLVDFFLIFFAKVTLETLAILIFDDFEPLPQISLTWYTLVWDKKSRDLLVSLFNLGTIFGLPGIYVFPNVLFFAHIIRSQSWTLMTDKLWSHSLRNLGYSNESYNL